MKIEVNLQKKYFFAIIGVLLLLAGIIVVYATTTWSNVPNPGHSLNDIGAPVCGAGQALTHNSSGWDCMTISAGAGIPAGYVENDTIFVTDGNEDIYGPAVDANGGSSCAGTDTCETTAEAAFRAYFCAPTDVKTCTDYYSTGGGVYWQCHVRSITCKRAYVLVKLISPP